MARVKNSQRLDFNRLAEVLAERGLVDVEPIREMLQASAEGGMPFPEALVTAGMLTDWDLGRVVCEVFHLPFLPADQVKPNPELLELFDRSFLASHGIVPLSRFGNVLTLALPGLVQAETLAHLMAETDLVLLPVVSTVKANRAWLQEHAPSAGGSTGGGLLGDADGDWGSLFDEGDAAVQQAISTTSEEEVGELEELSAALLDAEVDEDSDADAKGEFDLESLPSLTDGLEDATETDDVSAVEEPTGSDLPPMPEF